MTCFAIIDSNGQLVSTGTVVADPLPDGLSVVELTDDDASRCCAGGAWNGAGFDGPVTPGPSLAAAHLLEAQAKVAATPATSRAVFTPLLAALSALIDPT